MSVVSLNSLFQTLPVELVHLICLFTGKFIFDKNGKFKSIIDINDFIHIDFHLLHMLDFKSEARRMDRQRFIKYLRSHTYDPMEEEDRIQEELEWAKNADFYRHPSLFLKSSPAEEVMIPLESGKFCERCQNKCTSTQLSLHGYNFYKYHVSDHGLYFWYTSSNDSKNICTRCSHIITKTPIINDDTSEKTKIIKTKEKFPKRKSLNREKIPIRPVNYKKSFRRLL